MLIAGWLLSAAMAAEFTPEIQLRPRWEADTGRDGAVGTGNVSYVTMRSRLGGSLSLGDVIGRVVFADVRVFGEEAHTRRDFSADGFDMPIGTLTWAPGEAALTVGRMQIPLANQRLLAIAGWRQPGRSFDGARLTWARGALHVDARALLISEGDATDFAAGDQVIPAEDDEQLFVLSAGGADLTVLGLHQRGGSQTQTTAGALYDAPLTEAVYLTAEAYAQLRTQDTELAAMAAVTGWYQQGPARLGLQHEWLSGAHPDGLAAFDTVYGANHRYYGNIDVAVFQVGGAGDGQGLHAPAALLRLTPRDGLDIGLDARAFFADVPLDGAFLAVEPDLFVAATLAEGLTASGGVNVWLPPGLDAREVMGWAMLDLHL